MKILCLIILAGIIVAIDRRTLFQKLMSKQSIAYFVLLGTGFVIAIIYMFNIDVPSPFRFIEAFFNPIGSWLLYSPDISIL